MAYFGASRSKAISSCSQSTRTTVPLLVAGSVIVTKSTTREVKSSAMCSAPWITVTVWCSNQLRYNPDRFAFHNGNQLDQQY